MCDGYQLDTDTNTQRKDRRVKNLECSDAY